MLGDGDSGIAESLLGHDIYGDALGLLEDAVGAASLYPFPWDWRRDTGASIARLDAAIDAALAETGAEKVQIVAHSYGGLLALHYASDPARRAKLARVTSVGSPYMGSPKSTFPLLVGTELPFETGLEVLFGGQDDLRSAATTMRGLYNLWPSPAFGSFLTVEGRQPAPLDSAGTAALVGDSGGLREHLARRRRRGTCRHYDEMDVGDLPWRLIVSGGVPTIRRVHLFPAAGDRDLSAGITLAPGDGTVPLRSQTLLSSRGRRSAAPIRTWSCARCAPPSTASRCRTPPSSA